MDFEVWPEAIELGRLFAEQGYELALVGGPVRDLLLHRKSHDLDFCSSARPEQFEPIPHKWCPNLPIPIIKIDFIAFLLILIQ